MVGCSKCVGLYQYNTEEWVEKAKQVHRDKFDYSKVEYVDAKIKVCIICPIHGEFWQPPNRHLQGAGCMKCAGIYNYTTEEWIEKAKLVHGNKYDYYKVEYADAKTKVCIICTEHGEFWMTPNNHLRGKGCDECGIINMKIKQSSNKEEFIEKANLVHGDKYDYSKVEYINSQKKVIIICPEHGEFYQIPNSHLSGGGCLICNESKLEKETTKLLEQYAITFERQKKFDWLKSGKGWKSLDFYLTEYNIAIECQGKQHFVEVEYFGGNKGLEYIQNNDRIKQQLCEENNLPLYYINYDDNRHYINYKYLK